MLHEPIVLTVKTDSFYLKQNVTTIGTQHREFSIILHTQLTFMFMQVMFLLAATIGLLSGLDFHWANRANPRGLALLGASRLDIKTLLSWFFIFLDCSSRVKTVELFDYCVWCIGPGN